VQRGSAYRAVLLRFDMRPLRPIEQRERERVRPLAVNRGIFSHLCMRARLGMCVGTHQGGWACFVSVRAQVVIMRQWVRYVCALVMGMHPCLRARVGWEEEGAKCDEETFDGSEK